MNRVKEYRKQKDLPQMVLARRIDVARQAINLVENDEYNSSLDLCLKLAYELDTNLNALF